MRGIRIGVLCTMMMALGACGSTHAPLNGIAGLGAKETRVLRLSSSQSILTAPDGYCFDLASRNEVGAIGFVLMRPCTRGDATQGSSVFTIALAPAGEIERLSALETLLSSQSGRALLSRSGLAEDVELLQSSIEDDVLLLNVRDTSTQKIPELSDEYWRAITSVEGRFLSVTGANVSDGALAKTAPRAVVLKVAKTFREQN